jgi:hypothetical protein
MAIELSYVLESNIRKYKDEKSLQAFGTLPMNEGIARARRYCSTKQAGENDFIKTASLTRREVMQNERANLLRQTPYHQRDALWEKFKAQDKALWSLKFGPNLIPKTLKNKRVVLTFQSTKPIDRNMVKLFFLDLLKDISYDFLILNRIEKKDKFEYNLMIIFNVEPRLRLINLKKFLINNISICIIDYKLISRGKKSFLIECGSMIEVDNEFFCNQKLPIQKIDNRCKLWDYFEHRLYVVENFGMIRWREIEAEFYPEKIFNKYIELEFHYRDKPLPVQLRESINLSIEKNLREMDLEFFNMCYDIPDEKSKTKMDLIMHKYIDKSCRDVMLKYHVPVSELEKKMNDIKKAPTRDIQKKMLEMFMLQVLEDYEDKKSQ